MKLLGYYHTDPHGQYIDYCEDIVGNDERGIRFTLTYALKDDRFYASIHDTDNQLEEEIESINHDVAKFMIGEEEYNKLKEIHKDLNNVKKKPVDELERAFWDVLRLARGGQQPWWTDKLKQDSDKAINIIEQHYNEKYNK